MTDAAGSTFVYVTYIRTTPEKLWMALRSPEFTKQYWYGVTQESEWKVGSSWRMIFQDGRVADTGEVVEIDEPRRLVLKWRNEFRPELKVEGYSLCTIELEPLEAAVKLTITHEMEQPGAKFIEAVSGGWPKILSNLKSLLETGQAVPGL
ncbi:ATPase [Labrys miyagiensis]